jgi:hypothetical protein
MQACWNENPDLRPTSRDLEMTFNAWIDSITKRQLVCPRVVSTKKTVNSNSETENDDSASKLSSTPSQPLPSLSEVQHKILEEQDERRKYNSLNSLDTRILT